MIDVNLGSLSQLDGSSNFNPSIIQLSDNKYLMSLEDMV